MHREIQIKQFPIVTTHWWPKTRNERFVWETNSIYIVFYLFTQPCPSDPSVHTHPVCDVCVARALAHAAFTRASASTLDGGRVWSVVLTRRHSTTTNHILLLTMVCMRRSDWLTPPLALEKLRQHQASDTPSVKCWRRCPVWMQREPERARTHTSHTGCMSALRSLGHGCVQEVKNDINTVRFLTQTARFVS